MTHSFHVARSGSLSQSLAAVSLAAVSLAAVSLAAVSLAAVSLTACSSSDDVVAVIDEPASDQPSANAAGIPLTMVLSVRPPTATAGTSTPASSPLPQPVAGSAGGIGLPAPPSAGATEEDLLFVSGMPLIPPVANAEPWPLEIPLREFFPPAPGPVLVVLREPGAKPLRELGASYGLGAGLPPVQLPVEDDLGYQFELVLSEE